MRQPDWTAPIALGDHVRERARQRLGLTDPDRIRGEIRSAILAGRYTDVRPNWAGGLYKQPRERETLWVWDALATRCWAIVLRDGCIAVKTMIPAHDEDARRAGTGHLLPRLRARESHDRGPCYGRSG